MSQLRSGGAVVGGGSRQNQMTDNYQRGAEVFPETILRREAFPLPTRMFRRQSISGVTRDGADAPLPAATVHVFRTVDDVEIAELVSDADGFYDASIYADGAHYVVAYKAGAPDVTGATLNTLTGV